MANQCYFNGDFYQCAGNTTPGQSPATNPELWRLVQIPGDWRWVLARLTYSHLLELDGQKDKSTAERALAVGDDRRGLDWMIRQEANAERFLERPLVRGNQPPP